jgi:sec-independent protein translocase protein TatB
MFDIGVGELLVILIVAVVVIGPKDLPLAMRVAGRWIGQIRRVSAHFRSGIDAMVREAELEDMEKKWKAQNEEIMRRSAALTEAEAGAPVMTGPPPIDKPSLDKAQDEGTPTAEPATVEPVQPPVMPPMPAASDAKPKRPAIVKLGSHAVDPADLEPPREPMLPARPHTGDEDV